MIPINTEKNNRFRPGKRSLAKAKPAIELKMRLKATVIAVTRKEL